MVYIDNYGQVTGRNFGYMCMSHMWADSHEELISMVKKIGVNPIHIQHQGTLAEHFDISLVKRDLAIKYGALSLNMRDYAKAINQRCENADVHWAAAQLYKCDNKYRVIRIVKRRRFKRTR